MDYIKDNSVAEYAGTRYSSLKDAIDSANANNTDDRTITLLRDVNDNNSYNITRDITIVGGSNKHTIEFTDTGYMFTVSAGVIFELNGVILKHSTTGHCLNLAANTTVTVTNCDITTSGTSVLANKVSGVTLLMENTSITTTAAHTFQLDYNTNCSFTLDRCTLNVTNSGNAAILFRSPTNSSLEIKNGTIINAAKTILKFDRVSKSANLPTNSTIEINGSTLESTGAAYAITLCNAAADCKVTVTNKSTLIGRTYTTLGIWNSNNGIVEIADSTLKLFATNANNNYETGSIIAMPHSPLTSILIKDGTTFVIDPSMASASASWSAISSKNKTATVTLSGNVTFEGVTGNDISNLTKVVFADDYVVATNGSNYKFYASVDSAIEAQSAIDDIRVYDSTTMPSLNGYTTVEVNDATGKYYKFAVAMIGDVPYASLHRAIEAANEKDNITITICNDINLGNNFKVLTITKNLTIDGNNYTIAGINKTEEENPENKFNAMFDVNASGIVFTLKNITINYESSATSISRGAVIYNYDKTAIINIKNSTVVGPKVIYSNNTDSTINILGSTIIGTVNGAIILTSIPNTAREQKLTIDNSTVTATGGLGCITLSDSNTKLVIKGGSTINPNINKYAGYENLTPTAMAIYIAAGLNNSAEYNPTITIYDNSKIYNGPLRTNNKCYGAIYSNGDSFDRTLDVRFSEDYVGPAFISNAIKLAPGQLLYGYFYDKDSPPFNRALDKSFSELVPDNFGDDVYVLTSNDINIDNTIILTKNLHIQKATIVYATEEYIEKDISIKSDITPAFTNNNGDNIIITVIGLKINIENIINGFVDIEYKKHNYKLYFDINKFSSDVIKKTYVYSEGAITDAKNKGYYVDSDNTVKKIFSYFKNDELNILWNNLVYETEYVTQSKLTNTGLRGIYTALSNHTGLKNNNNEETPCKYMKSIAVISRYIRNNNISIDGNDKLQDIINNLINSDITRN